VLEARTDQFVLEFASRELAEIELWQQWDDGRELGAGVIDVKSFHPETPEDVAARIRRVLQFVNPEKLYLNPDCGFGWSPRGMCVQKLHAMVAGAQIVRAELSKA
jgi:5-methyltetrahydropteroyltriglutamate--homocysteine methyltransferase